MSTGAALAVAQAVHTGGDIGAMAGDTTPTAAPPGSWSSRGANTLARMWHVATGASHQPSVHADGSPLLSSARQVAAAKGAESAVVTLLAHGADVRQRSRDGSNARHWAERFHQPSIATLIEAREVELEQIQVEEGTKVALAKYQLEVDPNEVRPASTKRVFGVSSDS